MATTFDVTTNKQVDWKILPLDPDLYWMSDTEKEFFKAQTGYETDEELKAHVLEIQNLAYAVVPYPCIRLLSFLRLNITRRDTYEKALALGRDRPGAIYLDVGAGFGTDIRKLTSGGFPVENAVATDLHEGLWNAGHALFKSTPDTYPVAFVPGDVFQLTDEIDTTPPRDRPQLASLRSLVPLKGHVSVIYTGLFFHLFEEERGRELAERLALLLAPEPGSLMFGYQLGSPEAVLQTTPAGTMFCHAPETWKSMWEDVFARGTVRIEAELVSPNRSSAKAYAGDAEGASDIWLLLWSVERL